MSLQAFSARLLAQMTPRRGSSCEGVYMGVNGLDQHYSLVWTVPNSHQRIRRPT